MKQFMDWSIEPFDTQGMMRTWTSALPPCSAQNGQDEPQPGFQEALSGAPFETFPQIPLQEPATG